MPDDDVFREFLGRAVRAQRAVDALLAPTREEPEMVTFARTCVTCGAEVVSRGYDGGTAWPIGIKAGPHPPCEVCLAALAWIGLGFNAETTGLGVPAAREARLRWLQTLEHALDDPHRIAVVGLPVDEALLLIRECRRLDAALAAVAVQLKGLSDTVSGPSRPDPYAALRLRLAAEMQ